MNPWLYILLALFAWILIYALVRHFLVEEWLDGSLWLGHPGRGSILWLISAVIIVILSAWATFATAKHFFFREVKAPIRRGVVEQHDYDPAYTTTSFIPAGKVFIPTTHYHPERWWILVDGVTQEGKPVRDWLDVTRETHDTFSNGDSIYFKPQVP